MTYIKRHLEKVIKESMSLFSCIAVTGPRQSGKSTLLKTVEKFLIDENKGLLLYQGEDFPYTKMVQIKNVNDFLLDL